VAPASPRLTFAVMVMLVSGMNPYAAAFNPLSPAQVEDVVEPSPWSFDDFPPPGLPGRPSTEGAVNMNPLAREFNPCVPVQEKDMVESVVFPFEECQPSGQCAWQPQEGSVDMSPYADEFWPVDHGSQGTATSSPELHDLHVSGAGFELTSKATQDFVACPPSLPMRLPEPAWVKDLEAAPHGRFEDGGACLVSGSSGQAALDLSRKLAQATAFPAWATQEAWLRWRAMHGAIACSEVSTGQSGASETSHGRSVADEAEFDWQDSDIAPALGE